MSTIPSSSSSSSSSSTSSEKSTTKRRRGRPRKVTYQTASAAAAKVKSKVEVPVKRKRGRPAKQPTEMIEPTPSTRGPKKTLPSDVWYIRSEMMQHDVLTLEEEIELGRAIEKARHLNEALSSLPTIEELTDDDIITALSLPGGRAELNAIQSKGAWSRDRLMRCNVRLVVSIAKRWIRSGPMSKQTAISSSTLSALYNGAADRPSLDELIQEGMLGLARAADKYDPNRGLRFSTYSTHWITSYVRRYMREAITGCLKVPSQLHDIKSKYKYIMKRCTDLGEKYPSEEDVAKQIGVTVKRLRTAVRVTECPTSIDAPIYQGSSMHKGSAAGGDLSGGSGGVGSGSAADNELLLSDTLQCSEAQPEHYLEISFLRQCLENAMATELSPHERDVIRLRLGLDNGETKTVKQVVEIFGGGVSVNDVRSAELRAFKKLRSPNSSHTRELLSYLHLADIDHIVGSDDPNTWLYEQETKNRSGGGRRR
eukprot:CAMPEP_0185726708 /NCGR_PEP_ID=MMETSP1171-20130828/2594_1 /TAXON_ID=374046 /ORGANISM="Helicotheca tamensis, Strain CCMP826" /LENGTH=481 /DNA_ID=CAMNT_0028395103 /DNA_START=1064 /DNA_END=2509 /DNA_ORIENTATION=-